MAGLAEYGGDVVGRGDREGVDDAAARQGLEVGDQPAEPLLGRGQPQHAEPETVAGERTAQRENLVAAQLLGHILDHPCVGGGGGAEHRCLGREGVRSRSPIRR